MRRRHNPKAAVRRHKRPHHMEFTEGVCPDTGKTSFDSPQYANRRARELGMEGAYRCEFGAHWHIATRLRGEIRRAA